MACQAQVIIGAKEKKVAAVDLHVPILGAFHQPGGAIEALRFEVFEFLVKRREHKAFRVPSSGFRVEEFGIRHVLLGGQFTGAAIAERNEFGIFRGHRSPLYT